MPCRKPPVPRAEAEPRRAVPMKLQRDAALALCASLMKRLGLVEAEETVAFELDHEPALVLRDVDPVTREHVPHQHDPKYLFWRSRQAHDRKTNGRGGEKRTTTLGSDKHVAAKLARLTDAEIERHRKAMLAPVERAALPEAHLTKRGHRRMSSRKGPKLSPSRQPDKFIGTCLERGQ